MGVKPKDRKRIYQPKKPLIQQRTVILHPERMKIHPKGKPTIRSRVLPPPLPIETTFQRVGAEKNYFFLGAAFFMAPRGPQLATKMAPAFLGLAGALHKCTRTKVIWEWDWLAKARGCAVLEIPAFLSAAADSKCFGPIQLAKMCLESAQLRRFILPVRYPLPFHRHIHPGMSWGNRHIHPGMSWGNRAGSPHHLIT